MGANSTVISAVNEEGKIETISEAHNRSMTLKNMSFGEKICLLFKNCPFMALSLALSSLFFVMSGITYWLTTYFIKVLDIPRQTAQISFIVTTITSPIFGALISSRLSVSIGGHQSPKSLPICISLGVIAISIAIWFPFIDNGFLAFAVVWVVLFIGGIILPIMTGVMLLTVEDELRPEANAFANLMYNLIGYLPAPGLYGLLDKMSGQKKPRWGATMLMYTMILTMFLLLIAHRSLGDKLSRIE